MGVLKAPHTMKVVTTIKDLICTFPLGSGGERQPDAELKLDRGLGKRIWSNRLIQFDQPGLLTLTMGGPDSEREYRSAKHPTWY